MRAFPRVVVCGLSGGGGKTLLSLGLVRSLYKRGLSVKPYKKGPDYIDAAWLTLAAQKHSTNLDPFFLSDERLLSLFQEQFGTASVAIIEGNRGLYDGRDIAGSCSTARLANVLQSPILLALNCTKMTRTAAAVVAGLVSFEKIHLAGVVLNMIGSLRHGELARKAIETYTDIPVLGVIPRLHKNPIPERHMGLQSIHTEERLDVALAENVETVLEKLADLIEQDCNVREILDIARQAPDLPQAAPFWQTRRSESINPKIGYVRDAALWFYYEENLEALRRAGAELIELGFNDESWGELDGIYLGGGFPEMLAEEISASPHLAEIRQLSLDNRPIYAECGGFMILCRELQIHGKRFPMANIFPAQAELLTKPQGLGYVKAKVAHANPFHPIGAVLPGHEFHYSHCIPLENLTTSLVLQPGQGMDGKGNDGLIIRRTFAAYTHIFAPAVPYWAPRFVHACKNS